MGHQTGLILPQRRLFWECLQMMKACLYSKHPERKYSVYCQWQQRQSQGCISGEIRLENFIRLSDPGCGA